MNGEPLPAVHGFPARLVTPGLYGFVGATKWLTRMEATTYAAKPAYWTERDWATDAPILTQSRIDTPRGLNRLDAGRVVIGGVAWAQQRGIAKVEVRVDGGRWQEARLGPDAGIDYWRQWYLPWDALPGRHELTVRATDLTARSSPSNAPTPFPEGATRVALHRRHRRLTPPPPSRPRSSPTSSVAGSPTRRRGASGIPTDEVREPRRAASARRTLGTRTQSDHQGRRTTVYSARPTPEGALPCAPPD